MNRHRTESRVGETYFATRDLIATKIVYYGLFYQSNPCRRAICLKVLTSSVLTISRIKEMGSGIDWCCFQLVIPITRLWRKSSQKAGNTQIKRNLMSKQYTRSYCRTRASNHTTSIASSPALRDRSVNPASNPANEQLLFHGTNRYCQLAEDGSRVRLCKLPACYLCCIIRNSFDVRKCGTKHKFRRFGMGIYTTSCSSKADDYTSNGDESLKYRVLLVSRVVVGNPHKRRKNATNITEPPCGQHSVVGEPGIDLNYEETVVYDNDAIRPAFLIVYGDTPQKTMSKLQSLAVTLFKTPLVS